MSDIEIKNGKNPKYISIDLDPKEWVIIGIIITVIVWLLN
tara:strand:+ start:484 stop:603 length:120 start_codon:yes stop_codon:yes gene_type:complete